MCGGFGVWYLSVGVAHEDHLVQQFAVGRRLGPDLPEDQQELLERVVVGGHHKADDGHEQPRQTLTAQHQLDRPLQGTGLHAVVAML